MFGFQLAGKAVSRMEEMQDSEAVLTRPTSKAFKRTQPFLHCV